MGDAHEALDLPPVPTERHLTPAPEEFVTPRRLGPYAWPLLWLGVGVVLYLAASSWGWHPFGGH